MSLVPNRFLPIYAIHLLLNFGLSGYNLHSADALIKRLLDKKTLASSPRSYHRRYTLYSLTTAGYKEIEILLKAIYPDHESGTLLIHQPSEFEKIYELSRKDSSLPHAIAEAISYVLLLLSLPNQTTSNLEKEIQCNIQSGKKINRGKLQGNLISDISFEYGNHPQRNVFYEIDLITERMNSGNGIREKVAAYSALAIQLDEKAYHSSLQLIFSIFDDGWMPPTSPQNNYTEAESKVLSGNLHPYYFALSLAELVLQHKFPNRVHTLADVISLIHDEEILLNKYVYRERGKQYEGFLSILEATARTISPYGETPTSSIRNSIDLAANYSSFDKQSLLAHHTQLIYQKRRTAIFRMVMREFPYNKPAASIIGNALSKGMMLACCPGQFPDNILPYLLPELFFRNSLPQILYNLGLTKEILPVSEAYCLPLRGTEEKNEYGMIYEDYDTYCRNVFKSGSVTYCIENISDDIGGFLRAKEYLRLSPGFRPNTMLILLVNDDMLLADGNHINECTLFLQDYFKKDVNYINSADDFANHRERHFIQYETLNIIDLYSEYRSSYQSLNSIAGNNYSFPYLSDIDQDFIMLSYSEFTSATKGNIAPWLILPDQNGPIKVHRGPLPYNASPIPAAPSQIMMDRRPACNWDSLLQTD